MDDLPFLKDVPKTDSVSEVSIAILIKAAKDKKNILEIGTKYGRTAVLLAMSCHPLGKVTSVDINQKYATQTMAVVPPEIRQKITLIESDSKKVDYTTMGPFDMVFIDGDHSFNGVRMDTLNALKNLAPGAAIYWHDYSHLDVLAGLATIPIEKGQIDGYMGYTKGVPKPNPEERFHQLSRVAKAINEYLKTENWKE